MELIKNNQLNHDIADILKKQKATMVFSEEKIGEIMIVAGEVAVIARNNDSIVDATFANDVICINLYNTTFTNLQEIDSWKTITQLSDNIEIDESTKYENKPIKISFQFRV